MFSLLIVETCILPLHVNLRDVSIKFSLTGTLSGAIWTWEWITGYFDKSSDCGFCKIILKTSLFVAILLGKFNDFSFEFISKSFRTFSFTLYKRMLSFFMLFSDRFS